MTQDVAGQAIPARPRGGGGLSRPRLPGGATGSSPSNGGFPVRRQGRLAPRPATWLRAWSGQLRGRIYAQLNWWKSWSARSVQGGIGLATFYVRPLQEGRLLGPAGEGRRMAIEAGPGCIPSHSKALTRFG